jgi:hypothetical protein
MSGPIETMLHDRTYGGPDEFNTRPDPKVPESPVERLPFRGVSIWLGYPETPRLLERKGLDGWGVNLMESIKPMTPIAPMTWGKPWWPAELGDASASGGQNGIRYAFFRAKHRLLVERDGTLVTYDSGHHVISGIGQSGQSDDLVFTSQNGTVDLAQLDRIG